MILKLIQQQAWLVLLLTTISNGSLVNAQALDEGFEARKSPGSVIDSERSDKPGEPQSDKLTLTTAVNNSTLVRLYALPRSDAASAEELVTVAAITDVVTRKDGWLKVSTNPKQRVWIEREYTKLIGNLAFIQNRPTPTYLSTSIGAGARGNRISNIPADKVVKVDATQGKWLLVTPLDSIDLWVKSKDYKAAKNALMNVTASRDNLESSELNAKEVTDRPSSNWDIKPVDSDRSSAKAMTKARKIPEHASEETKPPLSAAKSASSLKSKPRSNKVIQGAKPYDEFVTWLCAQNQDLKLLQLSSFRDIVGLEFYLSRHSKLSPSKLHRARSKNGEWYYLIYGPYTDTEAAQSARQNIGIKKAAIRSTSTLQKARCAT